MELRIKYIEGIGYFVEVLTLLGWKELANENGKYFYYIEEGKTTRPLETRIQAIKRCKEFLEYKKALDDNVVTYESIVEDGEVILKI